MRIVINLCCCVVLAISSSGACAQVINERAIELLEQWIASIDEFKSKETDPDYAALMGAPDADLALLSVTHHQTQRVRDLAAKGLGKLKTDRSFEILLERLHDEQWSVRQTTVCIIGSFQQPRCIGPLLNVFHSDPHRQVRVTTAWNLQYFDAPEVVDALLKAVVDRTDLYIADTAAYSLGVLQVEEAVEPILNLIKTPGHEQEMEIALDGLRQIRCKRIVPILIDLLVELSAINHRRPQFLIQCVESDLLGLSKKASKHLGPTPDTVDQWRDWWWRAEPLFNPDLSFIERPAPAFDVKALSYDPRDLELSISLDAPTFRFGDPIRLDLTFRNLSDRACRTVKPKVPSGWWPTMAFGVRLERLDEEPTVLIDLVPSGFYQGSYSGPPPFEWLAPHEEFRDSYCLQTWLVGQRMWPIPPGHYRMLVSFDPSTFPGIKPGADDIVAVWKAPPVDFRVAGRARDDPEELLTIIGIKAELPWIHTDLTSRRADRQEAAWRAVNLYGDERLRPLLQQLSSDKPLSQRLSSLLRADPTAPPKKPRSVKPKSSDGY